VLSPPTAIGSAAVTADTWDRMAAGIAVTRERIGG
jgi:hypothetical protein